jgi:hypothetical protein
MAGPTKGMNQAYNMAAEQTRSTLGQGKTATITDDPLIVRSLAVKKKLDSQMSNMQADLTDAKAREKKSNGSSQKGTGILEVAKGNELVIAGGVAAATGSLFFGIGAAAGLAMIAKGQALIGKGEGNKSAGGQKVSEGTAAAKEVSTLYQDTMAEEGEAMDLESKAIEIESRQNAGAGDEGGVENKVNAQFGDVAQAGDAAALRTERAGGTENKDGTDEDANSGNTINNTSNDGKGFRKPGEATLAENDEAKNKLTKA